MTTPDPVGPTVAECAHHLALVANDVRAAGDFALVRLSEDGVTDATCTLSDELWIIALNLDYDAAMTARKSQP